MGDMDQLWERLRAFDRRCDIKMDRHAASDPMFWGAPRVWTVGIHATRVPGARIWDTVRGVHPTLTEAIRSAVEQGEQRGWSEPGGGEARRAG